MVRIIFYLEFGFLMNIEYCFTKKYNRSIAVLKHFEVNQYKMEFSMLPTTC